jgi:DNA-binding CsgD family transcriptional regulator
LVIAIDDATRSDAASLFAIRTLSARLATSAVLWVLAARRGREAQDLTAALMTIPTAHVELGPLSQVAMLEIVADRSGNEPTFGLERLIAAAGGEPALAVRLVEATDMDGGVQEGSAEILPPSFVAWLNDRLSSDLTERQVELVRAAAVLGACSIDDLVMLTGISARELLPDVRAVLTEGYLEETPGGLRFECELLRDCVYAGIADVERLVVHREVAARMTEAGRAPADIAPHVAATAVPGDMGAVALLRRAATDLGNDVVAAVALLDRARDLMPPDSQMTLAVTADLIQALVLGQNYGRALAELDEVWPEADDPRLLAAAASAMWACGRRDELVNAAARLVEVPGCDATTKAVLCAIVSADQARRGSHSDDEFAGQMSSDPVVAAWMARAKAYSAQSRGEFGAAATAFAASSVLFGGRSIEALDARIDAADGGEPKDLEASPGELPGTDAGAAACVLGRARVALVAGRLADATAAADRAGTTARATGAIHVLPMVTSLTARIALLEGRTDDAQRILHRDSEVGEGRVEEVTLVTRALLAVATGDTSTAGALLAEGLDRWPHLFGRIDNLVVAIRVAAWVEDPSLMRRFSTVAWGLTAGGSALATLVATYAEATFRADEDLMKQAVDITRFVHRPVLVAGMAEHLGDMLLEAGNRTAGVNSLDRAWDTYRAIEADGAAQRVRRRLSVLGVRRRRWTPVPARPTDGWDALTESERRVAMLAGEGLSNRDSAERLQVSPNTVATHLRAVYAKLGVSKRVQLARLVLEVPDDPALTESG